MTIRDWLFLDYSQLTGSASNKPRFPLPGTPPTAPITPPDPPIITYNLLASFVPDFLPVSPYVTPCAYPLRKMSTPIADKFFSEITGNDAYLIARIYEMIGYLLVPDTAAKAFFLLQGVPNSGKSIIGKFLEGFFPRQCITALDITKLGGQFLPDDLSISRLNLSMDLKDGILPKNSIAIIKMLTGDDLITHEVKYKDAKPFRGQCKLLFSINGKLKMTGRDAAFLDRIVCIPFKYSVPKHQRDDRLLQKLSAEREGIMMNALAYYRAFVYRNRTFSGDYSPDIEYKLSPNDTITEFVNEMCILQQGQYTSTEELYSAHLSFCMKNKLKAIPSKSGFSQRLSSLYATQISQHRQHVSKDDNLRGYYGICVRADEMPIQQYPFDETEDNDNYDNADGADGDNDDYYEE